MKKSKVSTNVEQSRSVKDQESSRCIAFGTTRDKCSSRSGEMIRECQNTLESTGCKCRMSKIQDELDTVYSSYDSIQIHVCSICQDFTNLTTKFWTLYMKYSRDKYICHRCIKKFDERYRIDKKIKDECQTL